jgi:aconitate hydratase
MKEHAIFKSFEFDQVSYHYIDFDHFAETFPGFDVKYLPFSLRVLLESNLRRCNTFQQQKDLIQTFAGGPNLSLTNLNVNVYPTRLLLQDYTGIPVLVDLCALRQVAVDAGLDFNKVNPVVPIDLVVDHSIVVDDFGRSESKVINSSNQFSRNTERFTFLKWCSQSFQNTRIIPPDSGICHQVNLESLATGFSLSQIGNKTVISPEIVIGTDSHTPTINSIGILGWGVGGIEGLTTALGHPIEFPVPQVIGVKLLGKLSPSVKATDCVLTLTALLRKFGVVEKFVEFFGPGVSSLTVTDRATISNMSPEYGATCAFFPWDDQTISFFKGTGRQTADLLQDYAKRAGFWSQESSDSVIYSQQIEIDLEKIEPVIAGPKRPDQVQTLSQVPASFQTPMGAETKVNSSVYPNGAIALAAITSCTNTANPDLIMTAGLMARNACKLGLKVPSWVKTLFAPGSLTVSDYLTQSGLQSYLDQLGFYVDGFGCTACIGNSGSLVPSVEQAIEEQGLVAVSVLSGNRNFSGRVQQKLGFNYLASPPLVLAYALAGKIEIDLNVDPIAKVGGNVVFLRDIWPTDEEVKEAILKYVKPNLYVEHRQQIGQGSIAWKLLKTEDSKVYGWSDPNGFVARPPFFVKGAHSAKPNRLIQNARVLLLLGDGVTTDDISPAGNIQPNTLAGDYLKGLGLGDTQLHTFGARRGNWQAMLHGAFTNINLVNDMAPHLKGGYTFNHELQVTQHVLEAAQFYQSHYIDSVIVAGKNYGIGSSRDDAARSTRLLGVKVVVAQSFERIHRSNLAAFSVFPLLFRAGQDKESFELNGSEKFSFDFSLGFPLEGEDVLVKVERENGQIFEIQLKSALRREELSAFKAGGILPMLSQQILESV